MTDGKSAAGTSKRILVVEDELMIRMLLEGMLTDLGHTVAAEAGGIDDGQSGVPELYRTSPTLQKPFQAEALAQAIEAATAKARV
jgi:hypothetical protein